MLIAHLAELDFSRSSPDGRTPSGEKGESRGQQPPDELFKVSPDARAPLSLDGSPTSPPLSLSFSLRISFSLYISLSCVFRDPFLLRQIKIAAGLPQVHWRVHLSREI